MADVHCPVKFIFASQFWLYRCSLCSLLVLRFGPPAEADSVEEAAVACGIGVTAAGQRQTALFNLRALVLHRFAWHFFGCFIWTNRDHFGLLESEENRSKFGSITMTVLLLRSTFDWNINHTALTGT